MQSKIAVVIVTRTKKQQIQQTVTSLQPDLQGDRNQPCLDYILHFQHSLNQYHLQNNVTFCGCWVLIILSVSAKIQLSLNISNTIGDLLIFVNYYLFYSINKRFLLISISFAFSRKKLKSVIIMNFRLKREEDMKSLKVQQKNKVFNTRRFQSDKLFKNQINPTGLQWDFNKLEDLISLLKSVNPCIQYLSSKQLDIICSLCSIHLQNQNFNAVIPSCMVSLTNHIELFNQFQKETFLKALPIIFKLIRSTNNVQNLLHYTEIYGNLQESINQNVIQQIVEIANILMQSFQKQSNYQILEAILWLMNRLIVKLIYKQINSSILKQYGQKTLKVCINCIQIIFQSKKNQNIQSNNKDAICGCFSLIKIIIQKNIFNKEEILNSVDAIIFQTKNLYCSDKIIMENTVELSSLIIIKVGLKKGIWQLLTEIINLKIVVLNGMILPTLINNIGSNNLSKYKDSPDNIQEHVDIMNNTIRSNSKRIFRNHLIYQQSLIRKTLIDYLLSYSKFTLTNLDDMIGLISIGLIDAEKQIIINSLKLIKKITVEYSNVKKIPILFQKLEETGIYSTLSRLQNNPEYTICNIANEILLIFEDFK